MNHTRPLALQRLLYVTALGICLGILAGAAVSFLSNILRVEMFLLGFITLILLAPFVLVPELRADPLSPAAVIAGLYFLYIVATPAYQLLKEQTVFLGRELGDLYAKGFLFGIIIVVSFWVGYFLPVGGHIGSSLPKPAVPFSWGITYSRWLLIGGLFGLFVSSRLSGMPFQAFFLPGIITTSIGTVKLSAEGGILNYLLSTIEWFIPGILLSLRFGRGKKLVLAWAVVALLIYTSIGFRYRILVLALSTLVLFNITGSRRLPLRYILLAFVVLVMVMVWIGENRNQIRAAGMGQQASVELSLSSGESLIDGAFGALMIFPTFLTVIDAVPSRIDYDYGLSMVFFFVRAIPRNFWPDKPNPPFLSIITGSIDTRMGDTAGAAYPNFGEYYIAFGVPSLILGMVLFGIGTRALAAWLEAHPENPWVQVAYALSVGLLIPIISRGYMAQNIQSWVFTVLPVLLAGVMYRTVQSTFRKWN